MIQAYEIRVKKEKMQGWVRRIKTNIYSFYLTIKDKELTVDLNCSIFGHRFTGGIE